MFDQGDAVDTRAPPLHCVVQFLVIHPCRTPSTLHQAVRIRRFHLKRHRGPFGEPTTFTRVSKTSSDNCLSRGSNCPGTPQRPQLDNSRSRRARPRPAGRTGSVRRPGAFTRRTLFGGHVGNREWRQSRHPDHRYRSQCTVPPDSRSGSPRVPGVVARRRAHRIPQPAIGQAHLAAAIDQRYIRR